YQSMVFDLVADPQSDSINYATGSLPTYPLEVIVEGRDTIPATGSVTIPEASAKGILHFTNDTERTITIPGGVIVTTSGDLPIRFITTSQVETKVEPYATIDLPAQAMLPGSSGNLYAYELDTIAGELEQYLEVINPDSMTGGTEVRVPSPNEDNFANLRQRLLSEMMQGALVQLQSITPTGDILLSPTLSATEIVNETTFPNIGEPGNDLELSMRVRVEGQVVSAESLHNLITPIMDSYTPDSFSSLGNTLEIIPIKNPTLAKEGKVHWTIRATRQLLSSITPGQITGQVLGKSVSQAVQRLIKTLPLAGTPDIVLAPSWWPCMPFLTMRIQVLQEGLQ
ncbi:MAG TPA: baseplate J/gp47 family protein, partial [Anaerolineales bacterium]|nr:baseplate J/gp47 family protein [Anaerolineales bacterium]